MSEERLQPVPDRRGMADLLTLGFGVAVAMWTVGYVGRLPSVMAPAYLLLPLFLACVVAGGFLAGRYTGRGWLGGAQVGLISGLVNLLGRAVRLGLRLGLRDSSSRSAKRPLCRYRLIHR